MKQSDIKTMNIPNREAAAKFVEIDDIVEQQTGQSVLGDTKKFLIEILDETADSNIPGAFSAVLNSRLKGKLQSIK